MRNKVFALLTAIAALAFMVSPAAAAGPATRGFMLDSGRALIAFDPATNTITNRVPIPANPTEYAVRPDGREIYVNDYWNDNIVVISTASMTVVATIPVSSHPTGIAFTPNGARAYVPNDLSDTVTVIDTAARRVVATIPVPDANKSIPGAAPNGARIYVGGTSPTGAGSVAVINTATNTVSKTIPFPVGGPNLIEVSPNSRFVLANSGDVIDASTDTVLPFSLGVIAEFDIAPNNTTAYLAYPCVNGGRGELRLTDITTGRVIRTIINGRNPGAVALTPDATRLYAAVDGGRAVVQIDPATNRIVDTFGAAATTPRSFLRRLTLSDTAPASQPGQRFAPEPATNRCGI